MLNSLCVHPDSSSQDAMAELRRFIFRQEVLKLYRSFQRISRLAPPESRRAHTAVPALPHAKPGHAVFAMPELNMRCAQACGMVDLSERTKGISGFCGVCVAQASCVNKCVKRLKLREARGTSRQSNIICQMAGTS